MTSSPAAPVPSARLTPVPFKLHEQVGIPTFGTCSVRADNALQVASSSQRPCTVHQEITLESQQPVRLGHPYIGQRRKRALGFVAARPGQGKLWSTELSDAAVLHCLPQLLLCKRDD